MRHPTASLSIGLGCGLAIGILASIVAIPAGPALSSEPTKTLKLVFGHTGETGTFTFKRNGVYDQGELKKINHFLRDWRKDQSTRIDPHLLDLVWAIYEKTGSHDAIHVVSAYRSPATNEMLRSRAGSGVAKHSQHRLGKAMDWYLTDVPLAKLRAAAMQMQGGGVGYYPRSGSPFVHTDTGNVRAWPRMSRQQLLALFPNGNTLHLPADGKPLPGYEQAVARRNAGSGTALAYLDTSAGDSDDETDRTGTDSSTSWLKRVFPGKRQDNEVAAAAPADAPAPAPTAMPPSDAPQVVAAVDEAVAGDLPRQPRARPDNAFGGETILASVEASDDAVSTPLPKSRPGQDESAAATAVVIGADEIASLTERMNQEFPDSTADAPDPIALAFAAASEARQPAEADRAILAAFATLADSDAIRPPDPDLSAALTRFAADEQQQQEPPEQPAPIAVSYAASDLLLRTSEPQVTGTVAAPEAPIAKVEPAVFVEPAPTVEAEPKPTIVAELKPTVVAEPAPTVVAEREPAVVTDPEPGLIILASAEAPSYDGDESSLLHLIETPVAATPASTGGEMAMPVPASGLLVAPGGASDVADLRGQSGPPVEHFTRKGGAQPEEGFLSRLFASLVE